MPRSPLTEQYQRVMSLVEQLHALEPDERNFILDLLVPEPEPVSKPQKKSSKKAAGKGGGKSKHASSLAEKVGGTLASIAKTAGGSDDNARKVIDTMDAGSSPRCQFTRYDGKLCLLLPDHNIHHLATHPEYHEFQPAEQAAATSGD